MNRVAGMETGIRIATERMGQGRVWRSRCSAAYRLLVYFTVVWLAIFYPAVCQYHGLRWLRTSSPTLDTSGESTSAHDHATHAPSPHQEPLPTTGEPANRPLTAHETGPSLRHKPVATETAVMSLLTMAAPPVSSFGLRPVETVQAALAPLFAHQADHSPPLQPPRLLSV
jgi:hypothetical protein